MPLSLSNSVVFDQLPLVKVALYQEDFLTPSLAFNSNQAQVFCFSLFFFIAMIYWRVFGQICILILPLGPASQLARASQVADNTKYLLLTLPPITHRPYKDSTPVYIAPPNSSIKVQWMCALLILFEAGFFARFQFERIRIWVCREPIHARCHISINSTTQTTFLLNEKNVGNARSYQYRSTLKHFYQKNEDWSIPLSH